MYVSYHSLHPTSLWLLQTPSQSPNSIKANYNPTHHTLYHALPHQNTSHHIYVTLPHITPHLISPHHTPPYLTQSHTPYLATPHSTISRHKTPGHTIPQPIPPNQPHHHLTLLYHINSTCPAKAQPTTSGHFTRLHHVSPNALISLAPYTTPTCSYHE